MTKRWLPKYVGEFTDRHGKKRYRYRRAGVKVGYFKNLQPGSKEFLAELAAFEDMAAKPGEDRVMPGTFDELLARYYRSPEFLDLRDSTKRVYRGVFERWREKRGKTSGKRRGAAKVSDLKASHLTEWMGEMIEDRNAANMLRKRLSALMDFAVRNDLARVNPLRSTKALKVVSDGFHAWTDAEIAQFEARHPVGTKARMVLDLLLWTGQRGGDVRVMGRGNIVRNRLVVTQEKTGAVVALPILKPLADSLLASNPGVETFLLTERGKPFSRKGFGNWFRDRCDEAELPQCSAHGLRKAAARRFAEAGCSNQEIKAWTGHTTEKEVSRYTASASQEMLSDAAAERLMLKFGGEPARDGVVN